MKRKSKRDRRFSHSVSLIPSCVRNGYLIKYGPRSEYDFLDVELNTESRIVYLWAYGEMPKRIFLRIKFYLACLLTNLSKNGRLNVRFVIGNPEESDPFDLCSIPSYVPATPEDYFPVRRDGRRFVVSPKSGQSTTMMRWNAIPIPAAPKKVKLRKGFGFFQLRNAIKYSGTKTSIPDDNE